MRDSSDGQRWAAAPHRDDQRRPGMQQARRTLHLAMRDTWRFVRQAGLFMTACNRKRTTLPLPVRWVPLETEPRLGARAGQAGTHGPDRSSPHSLDPGRMQSYQRLCASGCRWVKSIGGTDWQGNGVAVTAL